MGSLLNPNNSYKTNNSKKLKSYLTNDLELKYEKATESNYSNLVAGLLSYMLSEFSGQDYQTMLTDKIFNKYDMNQSTTIRNQIKTQLVSGLDDKGKKISNWDLSVLIGALFKGKIVYSKN